MNFFDFFIDMKKCLICFVCLIFSFCLCSCCSAKPVATTHTERIETHLHPIPIGADTIIIESVFSASEATASSVSSVSSVREKENSVREKENSVRNTNSVRIKSTRGINISRHETDTTSTLRITLRPDTVYLPYTNHIRSDTIVVPDRICKTKLQKTQTANVLLILILIIIFIFLFKQKYKFYR